MWYIMMYTLSTSNNKATAAAVACGKDRTNNKCRGLPRIAINNNK